RNFDLGGNVWKNASPVVPNINSAEGVKVSYSNKGTKPFSLVETQDLKSIFEKYPDADLFLDLHSGASENYFRYRGLNKEITKAVELLKDYQKKIFYLGNWDRVENVISGNATSNGYFNRATGNIGATVEWNNVFPMPDHEATAAITWLQAIVIYYYLTKTEKI